MGAQYHNLNQRHPDHSHYCPPLGERPARPLEVGFAAAWEATRNIVANCPPSPTCSVCDDENFCPRCPAYSYLEAGSTDAPVPYLCSIARERRRVAEEHHL